MADLRYPVSIAGRGFLVSRKDGRFGRRSIPLQKAQQDTSDAQGEQSLNPEDLWRRSFESWHRGAGQPSFDRAGGDPFRFDNSLGIDPWEKWQLRLLADTERKLASTATGVRLVVAGNYLYCADGQTLRFTQNIPASGLAAWTTVTGTPAAAITGIVSDGFNVWVAYGVNGIYRTTRGAASASLYHPMPATSIGYVKGRLMAGYGAAIFNITASAPTPLSPNFVATSHDDAVLFSIPGGGGQSARLYKRSLVAPDRKAGDLLLLFIRLSATDALITTPPGWRLHKSAGGAAPGSISVFSRTATGDAGDNVAVRATASTTGAIASTMVSYTDVGDIAQVDDVVIQHNAVVDTTAESAPVTPTAAPGRSLLYSVAAVSATMTSWTPPAGYFERLDSAGDGSVVELADLNYDAVATVAGPTSTPEVAAATATVHVAIRPDVGDPLFVPSFADFTWIGFAEGQGDIYAAGFSGDKSLIYRTQVRSDGTGLDVPVVASPGLPDGEIVRSIYGYLGLIFIGTDGGLRMATSDANGDLTIGALIETPAPVRCFEGQGRYVWFGYEDFDVSAWAAGAYDGLGRLDLTQQTSPLVPAYASDLMVPGSTGTTEQVQSIVTFGDRRVFSIADEAGASRGVYASTDQKVATGYLDSGLITYGIADTKVATYLDVRSRPLVGSLEAYLSTDSGAFASIGTVTVAGSTRTAEHLNAGPRRGDTHEVRVRLNRASVADAVGPTVTRLTLRSEPAPSRGRIYQVPLLLYRKLNVQGQEVSADPAEALAFLEGLFDTQTLVAYREGATTVQVFVKDYEFVAEHRSDGGKSEQGICVVVLKAPGS